jgi:hypothetical protein
VHVHVGALEAVVLLCMLIILVSGWRLVAGHLAQSDNPTAVTFGQAMAYIL